MQVCRSNLSLSVCCDTSKKIHQLVAHLKAVRCAKYLKKFQGEEHSSPSDIWSVGLTLLAVAEGRSPISTEKGYWGVVQMVTEGEPPSLPPSYIDPDTNQRIEYSKTLSNFIDKCLKKNPDDRFSADELLAHPFLSNYKPIASRVNESSTPEDYEAVEEMCRMVIEHQVENARGEKYKPISTQKLAALARQMCVPEAMTKEIYFRLHREQRKSEIT